MITFVWRFILFIPEEYTQSLQDRLSIYILIWSFSNFCTGPGWCAYKSIYLKKLIVPNNPPSLYLSVLVVAWSFSPSTIPRLYYSPYPRARIELFLFICYAWHYWDLKFLFKWQCESSKPFNLLEGSPDRYVKPGQRHWVVLICFK